MGIIKSFACKVPALVCPYLKADLNLDPNQEGVQRVFDPLAGIFKGLSPLNGRGGIRTHGTCLTYTRFPSVLLKPLGHPSLGMFSSLLIGGKTGRNHNVTSLFHATDF